MKILVVNCGSSSLKYQLIDSATEEVSASGQCERIGLDGIFSIKVNGKKIEKEVDIPNHSVGMKTVLDALVDPEHAVLKSLDEIEAIGHRVVHGGEKFSSSVLIDEEVIREIDECSALAPLHNPANILGIRACQKIMPGVPNVAVFDTAFHQTMPAKAYLYGIPKEYYEKYGIRRYGFHGTSHAFVSERLAELAGLDINNSKMIICHIGSQFHGSVFLLKAHGYSLHAFYCLQCLLYGPGAVAAHHSFDTDYFCHCVCPLFLFFAILLCGGFQYALFSLHSCLRCLLFRPGCFRRSCFQRSESALKASQPQGISHDKDTA